MKNCFYFSYRLSLDRNTYSSCMLVKKVNGFNEICKATVYSSCKPKEQISSLKLSNNLKMMQKLLPFPNL